MAVVMMANNILYKWLGACLTRWHGTRKDEPAFMPAIMALFAGVSLAAAAPVLAAAALGWTGGNGRLACILLFGTVAHGWFELSARVQACRFQPVRHLVMTLLRNGLILAGVLVAYLTRSAEATLLCGFAAMLAAGCLFLSGGRRWAWRRFDLHLAREFAAYGTPVGLMMIFSGLATTVTPIMIGALSGYQAVGAFTIGLTIVQSTLGVISSGIASAGYPLAVRRRGRRPFGRQGRPDPQLHGAAGAAAACRRRPCRVVAGHRRHLRAAPLPRTRRRGRYVRRLRGCIGARAVPGPPGLPDAVPRAKDVRHRLGDRADGGGARDAPCPFQGRWAWPSRCCAASRPTPRRWGCSPCWRPGSPTRHSSCGFPAGCAARLRRSADELHLRSQAGHGGSGRRRNQRGHPARWQRPGQRQERTVRGAVLLPGAVHVPWRVCDPAASAGGLRAQRRARWSQKESRHNAIWLFGCQGRTSRCTRWSR